MKKFNKKSLALLIAAALLLTITVGSTVAYLVDSTNALVNTFEPTEVDTELNENFDGEVKKNIKVNKPLARQTKNKRYRLLTSKMKDDILL